MTYVIFYSSLLQFQAFYKPEFVSISLLPNALQRSKNYKQSGSTAGIVPFEQIESHATRVVEPLPGQTQHFFGELIGWPPTIPFCS
ncbi:hypothetical protein [Flavobacterium collinsii]|uniref:hypothetical protein n=1 Tax=Flavobacterium collinsii TaxID=1114861 RepID=UPI0021E032C5|nr:hypothetical protein [Flavobacterium collinsii]